MIILPLKPTAHILKTLQPQKKISTYFARWAKLDSILVHIIFSRLSPSVFRPPHCQGFEITLSYTQHIWYDSYERVFSPSQRHLTVDTRRSKDTGNHATGGILTRSLSQWMAVDPFLRQRGHWDHLPTSSNKIALASFVFLFRTQTP